MSVLQEMSDSLKRSTSPPDTQTYLARMHKRMIKNLGHVNESEIANAKKLEAFLTLLKAKQASILDPEKYPMTANSFSGFWSIAEQQALLVELEQINPELINGLNFVSTGGDSSYALGAQLEIGMNRLVKSFESLAKGITKSDEDYKNLVAGAGSKQVNLNETIAKQVNDMAKEELQNLYKYTAKELKEFKEEKNINTKYSSINRTISGKIDTVGLSADLEVSVSCSKIAKDIIEILKGASFTEKNYISTNDLHLGQTNPVRVFATVNANEAHLASRYFRMLQCFTSDASQHPESPTLFYRIRAIYELTGIGMNYKTGDELNDELPIVQRLIKAKYAKYLVWNNPFGGIRVIPTRQIVNEVFEESEKMMPSNWKEALYGPITLNQINLSTI